MLSIVPAALGIRQTQKAQAFNLMADGYRAMSLAKTYDAKAAAEALKLTIKEGLCFRTDRGPAQRILPGKYRESCRR